MGKDSKMEAYLDSICDIIQPNLGTKERMGEKNPKISDSRHSTSCSYSKQEQARTGQCPILRRHLEIFNILVKAVGIFRDEMLTWCF